MEILFTLFLCAIFYFLGWISCLRFISRSIIQDTDKFVESINKVKNIIEEQKLLDSDLKIEIEIEKINNIFYVFDKKNGFFLSQGKTIDDALEELYNKYPQQHFKIPTNIVNYQGQYEN